jgi:hypothetical protein
VDVVGGDPKRVEDHEWALDFRLWALGLDRKHLMICG